MEAYSNDYQQIKPQKPRLNILKIKKIGFLHEVVSNVAFFKLCCYI